MNVSYFCSLLLRIRQITIVFTSSKNNNMASDMKEKIFSGCPIRNVLTRICDKWSMLVIYTLSTHREGPVRFNALRKLIPDISQKMLTSTLRTLEVDGYVNRKVYAEIPPRVEYSLTDLGTSLMPHLGSLIRWALENFQTISQNRKSKSRK